MTTTCALCGDSIIMLCEGYFEIRHNKYACVKCVALDKELELRYRLAKKLAAKEAVDAAEAAKGLGEAIKTYGVNVGETDAKD